MTTTQPVPFIPKTNADALALEIAQSFKDEIRLEMYRRVCVSREHSVVYKAFRETMAIPAHQVKKSRPAIFFFILHAYDKENAARY